MSEIPRSTTGAIRVVLAEVSGLTGEFVKVVLGKQSDMEIVREVRTTAELEIACDVADVDVVVTLLDNPQVSAAYQHLIFRIPSVSVVAISPDRRHLEVYGRTVVREVALDQLVDVIRSVTTTARAGRDVRTDAEGNNVGS